MVHMFQCSVQNFQQLLYMDVTNTERIFYRCPEHGSFITDVAAAAGFLCDEASVLWLTITETPLNYSHHIDAISCVKTLKRG